MRARSAGSKQGNAGLVVLHPREGQVLCHASELELVASYEGSDVLKQVTSLRVYAS